MQTNPWLKLFAFLAKYKKIILIVFAVVLLGTYLGLRFFATQKYLSETIIYPANIHSVSSEDPTEQALQVLESSYIQQRIIDSFDLIKHYGFEQNKVKSESISRAYERHFTIERTPYASISISVLDKDPKKAAAMANSVVYFMNKKILEMRREKFQEWARFSYRKYQDKLKSVEKLESELKEIKQKYGIVNLEEQSAVVSNKLSKAENQLQESKVKLRVFKEYKSSAYRDSLRKYQLKAAAAMGKKAVLDSQFQQILAAGDQIKGYEQNLELEREALSEYQMEYEESYQNSLRKISYSFVVSEAGAADQPSHPQKVLIASITAISTTILLILLLIFRENYSSIKSQMKLE